MEVPKKKQTFKALNDEKQLVYRSKHFLLELYGCDYEKLNDESFLSFTLNNAAKLANATVLNLITNKFEPQGVTAIALLAESHLSIHTWPEERYCAVDIFTCGENMQPDKSCKYLINSLMAEEHLLRVINRDTPLKLNNNSRKIN